jgi:molybdopterin converting factor small subunit
MSMKTDLHVHLFGSLRNAAGGGGTAAVRLPLESPAPLEAILGRLDIARHRVQMVMVNHRAVGAEAQIHPGDRLALFPPEYPIFADWTHFRLGR